MPRAQATDIEVSRRKFDRELREFRSLAADYRRRGWFLAEAAFPEILVVLAAPQLRPSPVVTGVRFDYTDYDLRPPSVRLVDPFTGEVYRAAELPVQLLRAVEVEAAVPVGLQLPPGFQPPRMMQQQPLMQSYGPEDIPFLCIAGVREYHDHPGHSGDAWELHRPGGAGRLVRLLDVIDTYGIKPLSGYNINLVPQVAGFSVSEVPR